MLRNLLFAAMLVFIVGVAAMVTILGGCGGKRRNAGNETKSAPASEVGADPAKIGRLEKAAEVTATVYHAGGGKSTGESVTLVPGAWLLPAAMFAEPVSAGNREDADASR